MKNMKKLSAVLGVLTLLVSGCSTSEVTTAETKEPEKAETTETESSAAVSATNMSAGLDSNGELIDKSLTENLTLPDYSNVVLAKADTEVTEKEVAEEVLSIMNGFMEKTEVTDRAVQMGDTVNIDYVGTIDGVAFDGGNTRGFGADLVIGSHSYIDDFEDQLVDHMPGETVMVEVTFPDNYGAANLAGKDAVFETVINYILVDQAPLLTDEFVQENLKDTYGCTTVDSFRNAIKDYLKEDKQYTAVWDWLRNNSELKEVPEELVDEMLENYVDIYTANAAANNMSLESYLTYFGISTTDELKDAYRESAEKAALNYLIAQKISDAENISVDEAMLNDYFKGNDYSELMAYYGEGYVKMQVRFSQVYKKLLENTTFE